MSLTMTDLSKRYGKRTVFQDLSHDFTPGLTLVEGRSGAGKSTLLRLLATLERPSSGTIKWNGSPLACKPRKYRQVLGYAPQSVAFPEALTGLEILTHIGALKGLATTDTRSQATALLDRLGLGPDAKRRVQTYSGGMRRRLGLVQALLGTPEVLVLDEPTAELDPLTMADVHALIGEMAERAIVVMTTHQTADFDLPYTTLNLQGTTLATDASATNRVVSGE